MKILFVCEYYPPHIGGVEVVFKQLAQGLAKQGHDCHVVTCKFPSTREYEEVERVKIHRVNVPRKADRYWFTFLAMPKVFTLAKGVDLIHTTTFSGAFPAWVASRLLRKKCVITVHEVWGSLWKNLVGINWFSARLHQFLERVVISLPFDMYICVSNYTRNCLRAFGIEDEKSVVVYNGIDYGLFNSSRADGEKVRKELQLGNDFVYMFYGRPGVSKGLEYLIQAVPLIADRIPNARLLLILANGISGRYKDITRMIRNLNLEARLALLSPVPRNELPNYLAAADCVVVPSLSEGFGFAAAEACAMGKPVVASNVASLPEVVSGKCVLVESRNPKAIAEGVEKTYKDEAENVAKKVFAWDECVSRYIKIYGDIRGSHPIGGSTPV